MDYEVTYSRRRVYMYMLIGRGLLFGRYVKCQEMVRATYIVR